jgi:tetratricopeptide (TPR) repeat protein
MVLQQWRYVRSAEIVDRQLRLHFLLPSGQADTYQRLVVTPLNQEIESFLRHYQDVLHAAGFYLGYRHEPVVREGSIQPFTEDEQIAFQRWVEIRVARADSPQLRDDLLLRQRQRDRLIQANIQTVDDLEQREQHEQAAALLVQTVRWLRDEREAFQVVHYAYRAGRIYEELGQSHQAVQCYLIVADTYFNDTLSPEMGREALTRAEALLQATPDPALIVELHLAAARINFVALSDHLAIEALSRARTALDAAADPSTQIQLRTKVALLEARLALVWEHWQEALTCLEQALEVCPREAINERFALLSLLLTAMTQCHDIRADKLYKEALVSLHGEEERHQVGLLHMYYAGSLASRGLLEQAYKVYQDAIKVLDGIGSLYEMCVLYQNMLHMLLRHGGDFFRGYDQFDNLRIDLFHRTRSQHRGYRHEQEAFECIVREKHRDVMRHTRLAFYHYWSDGAWFGLRDANRLLARHHTAVGEPQIALFYAIEARDSKLVEQLSSTIARRAEPATLFALIPKLISYNQISSEHQLIALSLGELADVVPPNLLSSVLEFLLILAQVPEYAPKQRRIRKEALKALTSFVPQLDKAQTKTIVQLAITVAKEQQHWTIYDAILDLLDACFIQTLCRVDRKHYAPVVQLVNKLSSIEALKSDAEHILPHIARTAPPKVRAKLITLIRSLPRSMDRAIDLAFLRESLTEDEIKTAIDSVVEAINVVPQTKIEDIIGKFSYHGKDIDRLLL